MFGRGSIAFVTAALAASLSGPLGAQRVAEGEVTVAAAASLGGVAPLLSRAFREATGVRVQFTFGGSNTLARQIVEGARVDAFLSADEVQMDVVERAGRVVPGTRVDLLGNQLVVIVPADRARAVRTAGDLAGAAVRRVAMGDPAAVPAGVYGRQWLERLELWAAVGPKVVPLSSSPAALAAVRAGRVEAGIVYATDAKDQSGVAVALAVPPEDGPRIVYPAAVIRGGREDEGRAFLAFLRGPAATRIFEAAGFHPAGGGVRPILPPAGRSRTSQPARRGGAEPR